MQLSFVLLPELLNRGPSALARHRYGCRVLERIIENFPPHPIHLLIDYLLQEDVTELCRHCYGNFVVQHILEFGTDWQKGFIVDKLREDLQAMAVDQYGCSVLDKALSYADLADQCQLADKLVKEPGLLVAMASLRQGFAATQRVFQLLELNPELHEEARALIRESSVDICRYKHGRALLNHVCPDALTPSELRSHGSNNGRSNGKGRGGGGKGRWGYTRLGYYGKGGRN